jgi:hypothetical protein
MRKSMGHTGGAPEGDAELSDTFMRSVAEYGVRLEAAMFQRTERTIHLLRAYHWARQLGAELHTLPWITEYLDRVAERLHRAEPKDAGEVAKAFEMTGVNRRPDYPTVQQQEWAAAVTTWRREHPRRGVVRAMNAVAEKLGVPEPKVRHAYYYFHDIK